MSDAWVGIPVYNNATTIANVARRAREVMDHVVVVDDGSTDADLHDVLRSLDITVLRHDHNQGKGAALLTAFHHVAKAGGSYLLTLDGDGQHFPEDIPRFIERLAPDTILLGHRAEIRGDMPRSSRFGRRFSDFWIFAETFRWVLDSQSGFRAYPVQHILQLPMWSRHYNFEMEVLTRAIWAGLRVESVPVQVWYPPAAERVSHFHKVRDNFRISRVHIRLLARRFWPVPHRRLVDKR